MNTDGTADTHTQQRMDLYREATEAAASECREVQAEIASLEARAASLRGRETALNGLVGAMRALFPVPPERPAAYTPVSTISSASSALRNRRWEAEPATA
jgi:hypothetical protein